MKIVSLVINHFINDNRVFKTAKSLQDAGHEMEIVALHKDGLERYELFHEVPVRRLRPRAMSLRDGNKLYGLIKYMSYCFLVVKKYRKADAWHCNDFEAMLIGCVAKCTRPRLKLVYDCHEYERERNGISSTYRRFVRLFEPLAVRMAAAVITVSEGIRLEYERIYHPRSLHLVMNVPHRAAPPKSNTLRELFKLRSDQKIYLYQGLLTHGRGVEMLLDVFGNMKDDRRVVVFMGNGRLVPMAQQYAAKSNNIFHHPAVPYEEIMRYTTSADFGVNSMQNVSLNYYYALPNKLFEYIQAGIPIVTNNLFECRKIVEDEGCGVVIEEFTKEGILDAFDRIEGMSRDEIIQHMIPLREKYNWENEEKKLVEIYRQLSK